MAWSHAWRTPPDAGVRFANGSDFPVESPAPLPGWYAGVTRRDPLLGAAAGIPATRVLRTVAAGETVHAAREEPGR